MLRLSEQMKQLHISSQPAVRRHLLHVTENVHSTSELVSAFLAVQSINELRRVVLTRLLIAATHLLLSVNSFFTFL